MLNERLIGTLDALFINWMWLAKERMNEVREYSTCLAIEDWQSGSMVIAKKTLTIRTTHLLSVQLNLSELFVFPWYVTIEGTYMNVYYNTVRCVVRMYVYIYI